MRRASLLLFLLAPCGVSAQVSYERLVRAESESQHWLTYSGSYRSQRFSALKQITPENVSTLKPVWVYQVKEPGLTETPAKHDPHVPLPPLHGGGHCPPTRCYRGKICTTNNEREQ